MNQQVEYVARAFYDAEGEGQSWDREPDILKDEFRIYARRAIALIEEWSCEEFYGLEPAKFADAA